MAKNPGKVYLVGAGPGDPGLLTLRAAHVLSIADVLLYDALASDAVVAMVPPNCERVFVGKRGGRESMPQDEIEALVVQKAREHRHVVRLKGGDPFVFGRGGEEAQRLASEGIPFEIVPGISSAIAAPAYAGIPVTHRDHNPAFTVATGHEDPAKERSTLDWQKLADPHRTLVLLMATANLEEIARQLVANGLPAKTPVAVVQNGTRPNQQSVTGTLATIAGDAREAGVGSPAVVVVGEVVRLRDEIGWFDRQPLFGKRVLVTRPQHQSSEIAAALYERGALPILAPAIAIGPPSDQRAVRRAIDDLSTFAWIVFTSQNGVDAFFERLAALNADARYVGKTKVAAIGAKTAARLARFGLRPDIVPAEFVSEEIGRALIEAAHPGERVLIFRAQEARDVLPEALRAAGRRVDVVAAYKTVELRDPAIAEAAQAAGVWTFTSPSTVRALVENLPDAAALSQRKIVACIGPVTAEAARAEGFAVHVVADEFTADGLLDALEETPAPQ